MEPVRVKAYGLVPITRNAYLGIQAVGAVVLVVLYLAADYLPVPEPFRTYWRWFVLVIVALEVVETAVMLWKFHEAERAARAADRDARPPHP